jgi:protein-tyrosine phosphatase
VARPWNLRDIGGFATPDGPVRSGLVWRSSELSALGPDGLEALAEAGVRTAIDLREETERAQHPVDLSDTEIVHRRLPLIDLPKLPAGSHTVDGMLRWLVERRGPRIVALMRVIASGEDHPLVFFCTSGKDRTGLASGILLSALGVEDGDVADDFHRSELLMPDDHAERALRLGAKMGIPAELAHSGLLAPRQVMMDVLAVLRERYDGTLEYLRRHGMSMRELDALHAVLVA